jgi:hypothetical protein
MKYELIKDLIESVKVLEDKPSESVYEDNFDDPPKEKTVTDYDEEFVSEDKNESSHLSKSPVIKDETSKKSESIPDQFEESEEKPEPKEEKKEAPKEEEMKETPEEAEEESPQKESEGEDMIGDEEMIDIAENSLVKIADSL